MDRPDHASDLTELDAAAAACRTGAPGACERLAALLRGPLGREVARFLGPDSAAVDDVIQESLLTSMRYVQADVEFDGDLVRLAVTIARNRCRDLLRKQSRHRHAPLDADHEDLPDPRPPVTDRLEHEQRHALLQRALDQLDPDCRRLLQGLFQEGRRGEDLRRELGLGTVQTVYQRKAACLARARKIFQNLSGVRSSLDSTIQRGTDGRGEA